MSVSCFSPRPPISSFDRMLTDAVMREEFETTMRMMGCTDISQLHPGLLNLYDIDHWFKDGPISVELRPKL